MARTARLNVEPNLLLLVLLVIPAVSSFPHTQSNACEVNIDRVDFPAALDLGQSFEVRTQVTASFFTPRGHFATGRADLVDTQRAQVLSRRLFDLGYASTPKTVTTVATHTAAAPPVAGDWPLQVMIYCITTLSGDSQITASSGYAFTIRVGSITVTAATSIMLRSATPATSQTLTITAGTTTITEIVTMTTRESPYLIISPELFLQGIVLLLAVAFIVEVVLLVRSRRSR